MADVDTTIFNEKLREYRRLTGKSWQVVVKQQAKLVAQRLMQLTFPSKKADGSKRVAIDIGRVYLTNEWFEDKFQFRNEHLGKRIQTAVRAGDSNTLQTIFANSAKLNRLHIEPFDAQKHKTARRNGRVGFPSPFSYPLTQQGAIKKLVTQKKKNVGMARSGWGDCLQQLGGKPPKWSAMSGNGTVEDGSQQEDNPYVIMTNTVPYFAAMDGKSNIVSRALAGRTRDMLAEAEKSLQQAAKAAGF